MLTTLIRRELLDNLITFRFATAVFVLFILIVPTTIVLIKDYEQRLANYNTAVKAHRQETTEVKTYSAAQLHVYRSPNPLSLFNITLIRLPLTFSVIALFGRYAFLDVMLLGTIAVIFSLDAVDGLVARKRNETSEMGALLDTLADRIIENTFWIYFTTIGLLPLWMPIAVMTRGFLTDTLQQLHGTPTHGWEYILTRSRISRGLYGSLKMIAFMSLASAMVFKTPFLEKMSLLLALAAIAFCLLRAIPIIFNRYEKKRLQHTL